jgi:hypothetical protein
VFISVTGIIVIDEIASEREVFSILLLTIEKKGVEIVRTIRRSIFPTARSQEKVRQFSLDSVRNLSSFVSVVIVLGTVEIAGVAAFFFLASTGQEVLDSPELFFTGVFIFTLKH